MVKGDELISDVVKHLDKLEKIPDIVMKAGLAYAGYRATNHWTGAIAALVGLKLATGNNLAGGAAGVTALTFIGLGNAFKEYPRTTAEIDPLKYPVLYSSTTWIPR